MKIPGLSEDVVGIVLIGAEGRAELGDGDCPWARDATELEASQFRSEILRLVNEGDRQLGYAMLDRDNKLRTFDGTGRPYWLTAILATAPEPAQKRAGTVWRCVYLMG